MEIPSQSYSNAYGAQAIHPSVRDAFVPPTAIDSTSGSTQTFPMKLYQILADADKNGFGDVVSWTEDGTAFRVHKPKDFVGKVMSAYFHQSKYKSFQRQLNMYGFQRVHYGHSKGSYKHQLFARDSPRRVMQLSRQRVGKAALQVQAQTQMRSGPSTSPKASYAAPPQAQQATAGLSLDCALERAGNIAGTFCRDMPRGTPPRHARQDSTISCFSAVSSACNPFEQSLSNVFADAEPLDALDMDGAHREAQLFHDFFGNANISVDAFDYEGEDTAGNDVDNDPILQSIMRDPKLLAFDTSMVAPIDDCSRQQQQQYQGYNYAQQSTPIRRADSNSSHNTSESTGFAASSSAACETRRPQSEHSFPWKLHDMLEDAERNGFADVVSWEPNGFRVHKSQEFVEKVMPLYFDQTKFESFRRQLNLYAFSRISRGPNRGMYMHPFLVQGERSMCQRIARTNARDKGR